MLKKWAIRLAIVIGIFVLAIALYFETLNVSVKVRNVGTRSIGQVRVEVTGASYDLGIIAPGDSKMIIPEPKGDSTVDLSFVDSSGKPHRIEGKIYFEPNESYRGHVVFSIDETKGDHQRVDASVRLFF